MPLIGWDQKILGRMSRGVSSAEPWDTLFLRIRQAPVERGYLEPIYVANQIVLPTRSYSSN